MCGILGVLGKNERRDIIYHALRVLNSRGQEATGVCFDGKCFKTFGTAQNLPEFEGYFDKCIGGTRYPTIGPREKKELERYSPPFFRKTNMGELYIAHNGNIIYPKLEKEERNDGELIARLLADNLGDGLEQSIRKFMEVVDGAYSVVGLIGDKMFLFTDPHNIRPAFFGTLGDTFFVASETEVLEQRIGVENVVEVGGGSLVIFERSKEPEIIKIVEKDRKRCMFEYTYFMRQPSKWGGKEIYKIRLELGKLLGNKMAEEKQIRPDLVSPIPFTSIPAAIGCAESFGSPYREVLLKDRDSQRLFQKPEEKQRNMPAYSVVESHVEGKNIVLVDDSIVRGTTLKTIIKALRKHNPSQIHVGSVTPPIKYPCMYGIDMSSRGELVAHSYDENEIAEIIGADSLTYLSVNDLESIIGRDICTACLDGRYPTKKAMEIFKNLQKMPESRRCYE